MLWFRGEGQMSHSLPLRVETEFLVSISLVLFARTSLGGRGSAVGAPAGRVVSRVVAPPSAVAVPEASTRGTRTVPGLSG